MRCQAKVQDGFGNKYKCNNEATTKIKTETFASHLQKNVIKERCLCSTHAKRLKARFRYAVKHCGKKSVITEIELNHKPVWNSRK